jgi:hypothetical protein
LERASAAGAAGWFGGVLSAPDAEPGAEVPVDATAAGAVPAPAEVPAAWEPPEPEAPEQPAASRSPATANAAATGVFTDTDDTGDTDDTDTADGSGDIADDTDDTDERITAGRPRIQPGRTVSPGP